MTEIHWKKLINPQILDEIEKRFNNHILLSNDQKEALRFARWLEPIIENGPNFAIENPEMADRYHNLVVKCKFIALALLPLEEIEGLFERHIAIAFQLPEYYDVWDYLKVKLVAMLDYEKRDEIKRKLRRALANNQTFLTPDILITENGKENPPTVANWLKNYIDKVGNEPADVVQKSEYLSKNKNVQKLNPADRLKIEKIIALFENLKLSSLTMIGLEEKVPTVMDGKLMVFREGRLEGIDPKVEEIISRLSQAGIFDAVPEMDKKKVLDDYIAGEKDNAAIEKEKIAIYQMAGQDISKMHNLFLSFVLPVSPASPLPSVNRCIAVILVFIEKGWLLKLLNEPNPIREEFIKYLKQEDKPEDLKNFELAPVLPLSLAKFLYFVLARRMRMGESEAAAIAARIGNILKQAGKPEYFGMGYWDEGEGRFKFKI